MYTRLEPIVKLNLFFLHRRKEIHLFVTKYDLDHASSYLYASESSLIFFIESKLSLSRAIKSQMLELQK